jgi:probable HAF family extracellular repeat protein
MLEISEWFSSAAWQSHPDAKNKRRFVVKRIFHLNLRGFILAATFSAGLGIGTGASAQQHSYLIDLNSKMATDIDTLEVGPNKTSYAQGINDAGQVVAWSYTTGHTFVVGPNGMGFRDLGEVGAPYFGAYDNINSTGQVVGQFQASGHGLHAFITGPNGMGLRDLGTLEGDRSTAFGINDAGQAVGFSSWAGGSEHAFITGPNGMGMRDLGTLGGTESLANAINDAGQVVGFSRTSGDFGQHAFITGPDGMGMRDLGTLGGTHSVAYGINESGQVVGISDTAGGFEHAFITGPNGMGMRDLGTLGGGASSGATGINDAGQVVGYSWTAGNELHAFITGANGAGMMDLNSLVHLPGGVILNDAHAINNAGQVVAVGTIPEPEISALFLVGLGLIGFIARRKKMTVAEALVSGREAGGHGHAFVTDALP